MTTLTINLADAIARQIGGGYYGRFAEGLRALFQTLGIEDHRIDLRDALAEQRMIAHVWCVDDVLEERPHLTEGQAWEVLVEVRGGVNDDLGITRATIRDTADELFPNGEVKP